MLYVTSYVINYETDVFFEVNSLLSIHYLMSSIFWLTLLSNFHLFYLSIIKNYASIADLEFRIVNI